MVPIQSVSAEPRCNVRMDWLARPFVIQRTSLEWGDVRHVAGEIIRQTKIRASEAQLPPTQPVEIARVGADPQVALTVGVQRADVFCAQAARRMDRVKILPIKSV